MLAWLIPDMLSHDFVRNALLAGGAIAAAAGLAGHFVVLRDEVFAVDALSHVALVGALLALAVGIDLRLGLFASTVLAGLLLAGGRRRDRLSDVIIGAAFAWILGLGALFLSLYTTGHATGNATAGISVLFGSIFGLSAAQTWVAIGVAGFVCLVMVTISRPLLLVSVDAVVAATRGVPTRLLTVVFLGTVALCVAEATQAVGALLILGLVATPPAAARLLTADPFKAFWLSGGIAVASLWAGVTVSYVVPRVPPSPLVIGACLCAYALAGVTSRQARRWRRGSMAAYDQPIPR